MYVYLAVITTFEGYAVRFIPAQIDWIVSNAPKQCVILLELVLGRGGRKVMYSIDMAFFTPVWIIVSTTPRHVASLKD